MCRSCNKVIRKLVKTNEARIYHGFRELLIDPSRYKAMSKADNPYGDGYASVRIADILIESMEL